MSEIKTAEHYVVAKLQETEDEVEKLRVSLAAMTLERDAAIHDFRTLANRVKERFSLGTLSSTGEGYISTENIYEEWDKEDFDYLVSTLGLDKKTKQEEKDNG